MANEGSQLALSNRVSIIVRTQGSRLRLLDRALESILKQVVLPHEVIVVEDGSTAASELVQRIAAIAPFAIRHIPIQASGRCTAGNRGLAESGGELLCFLDEDDEFYPEHLAQLTAALDAAPDAPLAYARADVLACNGLSQGRCDEPERLGPDPWLAFSRTRLWLHNQLPIQAAVFRRTIYEEAGGLDTALAYLEDWDLWIRYSQHQDFVSLPAVTSFYRMPKDKAELERRALLHMPWRDAVIEKHANMVSLHRFADVVVPPVPPPQTPTLRQAFGIGRRALLRRFSSY